MANEYTTDKIRNIAIIAHVDHGKTTLVDAFLKQSNLFRENQQEMSQDQILDSGDLEREKGITIKAKNIAIDYNGYKINIIDTPGHADFGGEVERTLNMADGCLLLVDAQEGPMPQTKFVLKQALKLGLQPILVINKIDKPYANPAKALSRVQDLFLELATTESQLDFQIFYAIGRDGKVFKDLPTAEEIAAQPADVRPLLAAIVEHIPAPTGDANLPLQMQITSLEFDAHRGRYLIGRIKRGTMKTNDSVVLCGQRNGAANINGRIKQVLVRSGLDFIPVDSAIPGDIVAVVGIDATAIGATICSAQQIEPLPMIELTPPAVKMKFEANTSPFVGKEGKFVTPKQIQVRLDKEAEVNIGLEITHADGGAYYVAGRGELQLAILIETMRRENYEFQVRKPEVVLREVDGKLQQPEEELLIDVPEDYQSTVTAELMARKAAITAIEVDGGYVRITANILTASLFGLRNYLATTTKGQAVLNSFVANYVPYEGDLELYRRGVMIATDPGTAMGYSLNTIQERGELFIGPQTDVYEGMIIGIHKYENDLDVNVTKERQKSGVRMKHDEITQTALKSIKPVTLEFALVFLARDEILEITPQSLRLRKALLTKTERVWANRKNLSEFAKLQLQGKG